MSIYIKAADTQWLATHAWTEASQFLQDLRDMYREINVQGETTTHPSFIECSRAHAPDKSVA